MLYLLVVLYNETLQDTGLQLQVSRVKNLHTKDTVSPQIANLQLQSKPRNGICIVMWIGAVCPASSELCQ